MCSCNLQLCYDTNPPQSCRFSFYSPQRTECMLKVPPGRIQAVGPLVPDNGGARKRLCAFHVTRVSAFCELCHTCECIASQVCFVTSTEDASIVAYESGSGSSAAHKLAPHQLLCCCLLASRQLWIMFSLPYQVFKLSNDRGMPKRFESANIQCHHRQSVIVGN